MLPLNTTDLETSGPHGTRTRTLPVDNRLLICLSFRADSEQWLRRESNPQHSGF